jgi:hypothetical protein
MFAVPDRLPAFFQRRAERTRYRLRASAPKRLYHR